MNLKELQKKVAEVLGVSNSQSELAFEIFSEKIYESLYEGITLKIPRIGFFQLKTGEAKNGTRSVIFTPLSVDFSRDTNNLYLTFEVHHKTKNTHEPDSNVFSIGVGKPLLPLTIDDLPSSETSFAVLKKSIEERAKELISEADQIPNFNIFEDYYKFSNSPLQEDETYSTLNDLTSDIDFSRVPVEPLDASLDEKIERLSSLIEKVPADNETSVNEKDEMPKVEFDFSDDRQDTTEDNVTDFNEKEERESTLDSEGKTSESLLAELLSDRREEKAAQEEIENSETKEKSFEDILATIDVSAFLNRGEVPTNEIPTEESAIDNFEKLPPIEQLEESEESVGQVPEEYHGEIAKEDLTQPEEKFIEENYADEKEREAVFEDERKVEEEKTLSELDEELTNESAEDLEPFEELLDSEKPAEEKIEWNWGDELREEFGLGHLESEEAAYDIIDEKKYDQKSKEEPEPEIEKDSLRDLFAQLEKTLEHDRAFIDEESKEEKKPIVETETPKTGSEFRDDEKVYLEYSGPPSKYEFVPVKTSEEEKHGRMAISLAEEPGDYFDRRSTRSNERGERISRRTNRSENVKSKMYLLYISIFVVVAIAVYLVMRNSSESREPSSKTLQQSVSQSKIDSIRTAIENAPDSAKYSLDESTDFPISATPPIPLKSQQSSQTSPSQTNISDSKKTSASNTQHADTQNNLYQTPVTDTRITNSIYFDGKNYNFQASSWRNKITAEQEVQRLRALNYKAYLVEAYLPVKGGTWYRVRIGPFSSENATRQFMRENNFK